MFDAIVIGAGQSGPSLAVTLAGAGWKVAIVERKRFGGTCVNNGCIPTKTLIASARAAWVARHAAEWGVVVEGVVEVNMKRVKARKDALVEASRKGVRQWLDATPNLTVVEGHARFVDAHTIEVSAGSAEPRRLQGERFVIDVGGRALVPDITGVADVPFFTNSSMMDVDFLPPHLIVVGGSYIGLEFGQMYRRFGSRVTIVERSPRLVSREDDDISEAIRGMLVDEGIDVQLNACCIGLQRRGKGVCVKLDENREVEGSHVLLAVGRQPNTFDLDLERAAVETDARGYIRVDDGLASNVPHIFATGDCNGRGAFTHTSYNDFEVLAARLLRGEDRKVTDRIEAYALYTDPPLGRCGMTERDARGSGRPLAMATLPMTRVGRAKERGETKGLMKLVIDAETRRILGASLFGIEGDEVVQDILDVMYADAPVDMLARAMHIHPTVSEFVPELAKALKPLP